MTWIRQNVLAKIFGYFGRKSVYRLYALISLNYQNSTLPYYLTQIYDTKSAIKSPATRKVLDCFFSLYVYFISVISFESSKWLEFICWGEIVSLIVRNLTTTKNCNIFSETMISSIECLTSLIRKRLYKPGFNKTTMCLLYITCTTNFIHRENKIELIHLRNINTSLTRKISRIWLAKRKTIYPISHILLVKYEILKLSRN